MEKILFVAIAISFLATLYLVPKWIIRARNAKLVGRDMHKINGDEVAESGGISVVVGFVLGVLFYIAVKTFYFNSSEDVIEILALTLTIVLIAFIGFADDILGWKIGLNKRTRLFFVLMCAVPLMVINAGVSEINVPFFGMIELGLIYALILIPLGIVGAATTFNFIAGYNGLETSQGMLIISALSFMAWFTGDNWLGLVGLCMVASLCAFWIFNKYPAKVFPGDVLTYSVGAMIAIIAILGNIERFAVFIFTPYILETFLKLRGGLKKESFGEVQLDGSIKNKYDKIYGLEHLAIRFLEKVKSNKKAREFEVVIFINSIQIIFIILGFIMFLR